MAPKKIMGSKGSNSERLPSELIPRIPDADRKITPMLPVPQKTKFINGFVSDKISSVCISHKQPGIPKQPFGL